MNVVRILFFSVLCFFACWQYASGTESADHEFESQFSEVKRIIQQARNENALWKDTERLLLDARKQYQEGNTNLAFEKLTSARQQAELGITQATKQKNKNLLPHYLRKP